MRSRGYFYNMYGQIKERLMQKAINENRAELIVSTEHKEGKLYMKGRKNQSLILYADRGAKRRCKRILLHLIYTEWRTSLGMEVRIPYPMEYLGHQVTITLDDVVAYDKNIKSERNKKK